MKNIGVVIPAFNAEGTIGAVIAGITKRAHIENIIVVDDGSSDATASIATASGARVLKHPINRGKGAALQTGFDFVLQTSLDAVITLDADLQHPPEFIPQILSLYLSGGYDIIIGNRLHDKKGMPIHRVLSNTITTFLVSARTAKRIADSQSGYRLIDRKVLESFRLKSHGFEAETEFIIKAASHGFRFGFVPIETVYDGEKSHMTHFMTTVNFVKVLFQDY
ncbi:MAG: glycosyltransferase family 2 protein [Bacteroidota bacterium]